MDNDKDADAHVFRCLARGNQDGKLTRCFDDAKPMADVTSPEDIRGHALARQRRKAHGGASSRVTQGQALEDSEMITRGAVSRDDQRRMALISTPTRGTHGSVPRARKGALQ